MYPNEDNPKLSYKPKLTEQASTASVDWSPTSHYDHAGVHNDKEGPSMGQCCSKQATCQLLLDHLAIWWVGITTVVLTKCYNWGETEQTSHRCQVYVSRGPWEEGLHGHMPSYIHIVPTKCNYDYSTLCFNDSGERYHNHYWMAHQLVGVIWHSQ